MSNIVIGGYGGAGGTCDATDIKWAKKRRKIEFCIKTKKIHFRIKKRKIEF